MSFLSKLAYHENGTPRNWVRDVMIWRFRSPRKTFNHLMFEKDGSVRPKFVVLTNLVFALTGLRVRRLGGSAKVHQSTKISLVSFAPPSLEEMTRKMLKKNAPTMVANAAEVEQRIRTSRTGQARLILSLCQDDYRTVLGGVQVCVQHEEHSVRSRGGDYLNLHPFQPLPRLAHLDDDTDPFVNLTINGSTLLTCSMSSLIPAVRQIASEGTAVDVVIHHLLGYHPEQVSELVIATGSPKCIFWLHDFFSICPSYKLQRNNQGFCNAPALQSNACAICLYGDERRNHSARMVAFFDTLDVDVISPSDVTLYFWQARTKLSASATHIVPHTMLDWTVREVPLVEETPGPVTVGYLGQMTDNKGWPQFNRLAQEFQADHSLRFVALGVTQPTNKTIKWSNIQVTHENPTAMIDAVTAEVVDIVLHWPKWPETFSLTTFEALEGGAFVVTNGISGNVAATVVKTGLGAVLKDEAALTAFFENGEARRLAEVAREHRRTFSVSRRSSEMSAIHLFGAS